MGIKVRKRKYFECGWVGSRQLLGKVSDRPNSGRMTLGGFVDCVWGGGGMRGKGRKE